MMMMTITMMIITEIEKGKRRICIVVEIAYNPSGNLNAYNSTQTKILKGWLHGIISQTLTLPPGKDFIFQINASLSGAYAADPMDVRTLGLVASAGTGTSISTFVAVLREISNLQKSVIGNKNLGGRKKIKDKAQSRFLFLDNIKESKMYLRSLNWPFAFTMISIRLLECLSTWASTQIRGFT